MPHAKFSADSLKTMAVQKQTDRSTDLVLYIRLCDAVAMRSIRTHEPCPSVEYKMKVFKTLFPSLALI